VTLFTAGSDGIIRFIIRVTPRASREGITGLVIDSDGVPTLKVSVTAPDDGGKANKAVLALLAKELGVPRTALTIQTGSAARRKLICLPGDPAVQARLNQWAAKLKA
jgi:uncharacterized protein YggU (UPF0235/DUF167 family)